jgi:predicted LPLAT superfamily acyltransferase
VEGFEHFQRLSQAEDAFLQLSSHVGNYELAGYTLLSDDKQFNALVYFGEKSTVMENRDKLFVDNHIHMIPVTQDMSHVFEMNRVLQNGEILSMPADRFFGSEKSISLPFLGKEARFPLGPFSVATARGINVITVHVMKSSLKGYKVYVTPLDYDKQAPRREQERQLAGAFVNELERILKMYPAQWYNYYEFWQS